MIIKASIFLCLFFMCFKSAMAQLQFDFELLARANLHDSYQMPTMSFINDSLPMINDRGDVGFKVMSVEGENIQGIWFKKNNAPMGKIVYTTPMARFLSDPYLTSDGKLIFTQYEEELSEGVFKFDSNDYSIVQILKPIESQLLYYTYAQMSLNGELVFRATSLNGVRSFLKLSPTSNSQLATLISEGNSFFGEKTSYLFKPSLNENGALSFKRRLGDVGNWDEGFGDQLLLMTANGQGYDVELIAEDRDSHSQSKFLSFGHSTALSSNNSVAFTALIADANGEIKRGVFMYQNKKVKPLVLEGTFDIKEIETFSPKINNRGEVLFRAKDSQGLRGLYLATLKNVIKVIGEGDLIMADKGRANILSNPNFPGFNGEIDINNNGEIVFSCLLIGADDKKEWGMAVYKATPK